MSPQLDNIDLALKNAIAQRLKELREKTGLSQTEFAYEHGKDKQNQNRLEKGRSTSIYSVNKFCRAVGISLSEFFDSPHFK